MILDYGHYDVIVEALYFGGRIRKENYCPKLREFLFIFRNYIDRLKVIFWKKKKN